METQANQIARSGQNLSTTRPVSTGYEKSLRLLTECERTVNALDLINPKPLTGNDFLEVAAFYEQNYGMTYPKEKWQTLVLVLMNDGWTAERFRRTAEYLMKSKPYRTWTIEDWFSFSIELHPESWYLRQVHELGAKVNKSIEMYKLPTGYIGYKYKDENVLPFPHRNVGEATWKQ